MERIVQLRGKEGEKKKKTTKQAITDGKQSPSLRTVKARSHEIEQKEPEKPGISQAKRCSLLLPSLRAWGKLRATGRPFVQSVP